MELVRRLQLAARLAPVVRDGGAATLRTESGKRISRADLLAELMKRASIEFGGIRRKCLCGKAMTGRGSNALLCQDCRATRMVCACGAKVSSTMAWVAMRTDRPSMCRACSRKLIGEKLSKPATCSICEKPIRRTSVAHAIRRGRAPRCISCAAREREAKNRGKP